MKRTGIFRSIHSLVLARKRRARWRVAALASVLLAALAATVSA